MLAAPFAVTGMGQWLVVADPLEPAPSIAVFGSDVAPRAIEAAAIYRQGFAREVWLTNIPEYARGRAVLEGLGVPPNSIRVLDGRNTNTADEIRAVAGQLKASGHDRVILVASKYTPAA
jgi:uncharacterized SAM-binding protein YcdF (DUF218 family)